jgi:hypothetical protein
MNKQPYIPPRTEVIKINSISALALVTTSDPADDSAVLTKQHNSDYNIWENADAESENSDGTWW